LSSHKHPLYDPLASAFFPNRSIISLAGIEYFFAILKIDWDLLLIIARRASRLQCKRSELVGNKRAWHFFIVAWSVGLPSTRPAKNTPLIHYLDSTQALHLLVEHGWAD
jgi:hypothetical protein